MKWSNVAVQWSGNGHFYEAVSVAPERITWEAASAAAQAAGGYLATSTSEEENNFIYSLINSDEFWYTDRYGNGIGPWLGGFQLPEGPEPDGGWQWVSSEPWDYTNWAYGEPSNAHTNENRLDFHGYYQTMAPTWNDAPHSTLAF